MELNISHDTELTKEQLGMWYLTLALSFLRKAEDTVTTYKDLLERKGQPGTDSTKIEDRLRKLHKEVTSSCKEVFQMIQRASLHGGKDLQIEDAEARVFSISSMNGSCFYTLGSLEYAAKNYAKAIEYFQKSYDVDPSQSAIFNIALSTIYLPAEGGGLFSGKKTQVAKEEKENQEIALFTKTVQYAPFSQLGIRSARLLVERYKVVLQPDDLNPIA